MSPPWTPEGETLTESYVNMIPRATAARTCRVCARVYTAIRNFIDLRDRQRGLKIVPEDVWCAQTTSHGEDARSAIQGAGKNS